MPHVTELSSALQTELLKKVVGISVRCILDPDTLNIDLSDYVNIDASLQISKKKSIMPTGAMGQYFINEIDITFDNRNDYFNHNTPGSTFYYATSKLTAPKTPAENYIRIEKNDVVVVAGDKVTIGRGGDPISETLTVSTFDTTDPNYDEITFTTNGARTWFTGTTVETSRVIGLKVVLKTIVGGVSEEIEQYTGYIKALPRLEAGKAILTIFDKLKSVFDVELRANSFEVIKNETEIFTVVTNTTTNTGALDYTQMTINQYTCPLGEWKIVFTATAGQYTITAPDGQTFTGNTPITYNFPPSGGRWITIPAAAWSGTFDQGDTLTFKTVCSLGGIVNSINTPAKMIKDIVRDGTYGASLPDTDLDVTSFDDLITRFSARTAAISFANPIRALKAVEVIQQHINGVMFTKNNGAIAVDAYPSAYVESSLATYDTDAIIEINQEDLGQYDWVIADYGYDIEEGKYKKTALPTLYSTAFQGTIVTIKMPAYHGAEASTSAMEVFNMWGRGVKPYLIRIKFNYGVAIELNDVFKIKSHIPAYNDKIVEVYDIVVKDLKKGVLIVNAYDIRS